MRKELILSQISVKILFGHKNKNNTREAKSNNAFRIKIRK